VIKKNEYAIFLKTLGEVFAEARRAANLTQAELGAQTGRGQSAIGKIERAPVQNTPLRVLYELSNALDIPLSEIFFTAESKASLSVGTSSHKEKWPAVIKSVNALPKQHREWVADMVLGLLQRDRQPDNLRQR